MSQDTQAITLLSAGLFSLDRMNRNIQVLARTGVFLHPGVLKVLSLRRRHLQLLRQALQGPTNPMPPSQIRKRGGI